MKYPSVSKVACLLALVPIFLVGLYMRSASLGPMSLTMLHGDEAWNGVDIVGLIQHPRLTPFLENNFGRESGWTYFELPLVLVFGATPFALRFATVCIAMLTLAASARLGREIFGLGGMVLMLAVLSVFYWHVHISQMALRINSYVLMGCLAAASLLHAYRWRRWTDWVVGGICLGLLGYTYFASYGSIAFMGVVLLALAIVRPRNRLALLALVVAVIVLLPMGTYVLQHPDRFFSRVVATATSSPAQLQINLQKWAYAFFVAGDDNATFNYPFRPILGPVTGLLFILGLINFVREPRYRRMGLLTICWGGVTIFPSAVSEYAPHFSRACGLIIPLVILMTNGLRLLGDLSARWIRRPLAAFIPLALLLPVGVSSFVDFHIRWFANPDAYIYMEEYINRSVLYLRDHAAPADYIYFSPFETGHSVIAFRANDLAPRHVAAFGSRQCLVVPDRRAFYTSLTMFEPEFAAVLGRWADVRVVAQDTDSPLPLPRYTLLEADPVPARLNPPGQTPVRFGDALDVSVLTPFTMTLAAGDQVVVWLGARPLRPLSIYPSIFIHLYGVPTPYQGGRLWAQADSELCASYPASLWQTDETIVQPFALTIPADLPPGEYSIAAGVYTGGNERLPITLPDKTAADYIILHRFSIEAPAP